jgi:hypothetical protein
LIVCIVLFYGSSVCNSTTVKFAWNQDLPVPNDLLGWNFYSSTTSGGPYTLVSTVYYLSVEYDPILDEYRASINVDIMNIDTWYFVLTAFDNDRNESGYSNEAVGQLLPPSPINDFSID